MSRSTAATGVRSTDTRQKLRQAVKRSQRTGGVNFPIAFVRSEQDPPAVTPLARMLRGGRGGEVRLKLYLSLTLLATAPPYDIRDPIRASFWAEALGLPDPEGKGARRITQALDWLDDQGFISVTRRPGRPSTVLLLDQEGTRGPFVPVDTKRRYLRLPLGLWMNEWIVELSGSALALFMVLLERQGGAKKPPYFEAQRRLQYGLSDDTWTRATKELRSHDGLLDVQQVRTGRDLDMRRVRNTYWLDLDVLNDQPDDAGRA